MPKHKRVVHDSSSDDEGERIMYVLGNRTKEFLPKFLEAFAVPFWQNKGGDEPDDESTEAETFLLTCLCSKPGTLDVEGILALIEADEDTHLPVMEALDCLLGYDIDMHDVESFLDSEEDVAELRRIVEWLPKWAECAQQERVRASKKMKSA
jgi:hypothetical protein